MIIVAFCFVSTFVWAEGDGKMRKMDRDREENMEKAVDTTNMQKDYEELIKLYRELKVKAKEFEKKYNMLPNEIKFILIRPGMGEGKGLQQEPGLPGEGRQGGGFGGRQMREKDMFE